MRIRVFKRHGAPDRLCLQSAHRDLETVSALAPSARNSAAPSRGIARRNVHTYSRLSKPAVLHIPSSSPTPPHFMPTNITVVTVSFIKSFSFVAQLRCLYNRPSICSTGWVFLFAGRVVDPPTVATAHLPERLILTCE